MARGKYDIVYAVKDSGPNEELRYSLRSVEKNWGPHGVVWIFGGCPENLRPDRHVPVAMLPELSKWENTHRLLRTICQNDEITEDFWYFNDDFFVMKPTSEDMPQQYNNTLGDVVRTVEGYKGGVTEWTKRLRTLMDLADREGFGTINYEVHRPILINRRRMLEVMDLYHGTPCLRSLYGNCYDIGGENTGDILITDRHAGIEWVKKMDPVFISTTEDSFPGPVGRYIMERFPEKCGYEK